jgi:hypothetical protein
MSQTGGKRKVNKSLKAWVAFIKKVQREEKLSYKDAMKRAKERKDKGEKWMSGGQPLEDDVEVEVDEVVDRPVDEIVDTDMMIEEDNMMGGRRHKRTMRRSRTRSRSRSARRTRGRGRTRSRTARRTARRT